MIFLLGLGEQSIEVQKLYDCAGRAHIPLGSNPLAKVLPNFARAAVELFLLLFGRCVGADNGEQGKSWESPLIGKPGERIAADSPCPSKRDKHVGSGFTLRNRVPDKRERSAAQQLSGRKFR